MTTMLMIILCNAVICCSLSLVKAGRDFDRRTVGEQVDEMGIVWKYFTTGIQRIHDKNWTLKQYGTEHGQYPHVPRRWRHSNKMY